MSLLHPLVPAMLLLTASSAWAGDLVIQSTGAPVFVVRGGEMVGSTPLTLPGLPGGRLELGFREAALSTTVFTQVVTVPESGVLQLEVNLPQRTANVASMPPLVPPVPVGKEVPGGDIYVTSVPPGASIFVDGNPTGAATPFVVRGVPVGKHTVEARTDCARASASLTVAGQLIARADLALVAQTGSLVVSAHVPDSRVFLDGVEVGVAPLTLGALSCGPHAIAVRAPGYLETTSDITVLGDEALNLVVSNGTVPLSPASGAMPPGRVVQISLRKEEYGTLVLDVSPLEAELVVDGVDVGAGPRSIERVAAGPHTVSGRSTGYDPKSIEVLVEPRSITRAALTLVPSAPQPATKNKPPGGPPLGRVALNVGVSVVGLGAGTYGIARLLAASEAYERYETVPSDAAAAAIYANEVAPSRLQAIIGGSAGLVGILAASGLWITTEF